VDTIQPALIVYGSSYFLPLLLLQILRPFALKMQLARPDWEALRSILRLSIPIFIAHAGYVAYIAADLLFLERVVTGTDLGVYALSKNLSAVFILVSMGVNTVIMPRIAGAPRSQHREILRQALTWHLVVSGSILVIYALLYNPVVGLVFGAEYVTTPAIYLVFSLAMVISQTHSLISQALVGQGKSDLYATSMIISLIATVVAAALLVPQYAGVGAASAMLIGAVVALAIYGYIAVRRLRQSASVETT
jgi:O-antigen/teichoic acid export membrane protein